MPLVMYGGDVSFLCGNCAAVLLQDINPKALPFIEDLVKEQAVSVYPPGHTITSPLICEGIPDTKLREGTCNVLFRCCSCSAFNAV